MIADSWLILHRRSVGGAAGLAARPPRPLAALVALAGRWRSCSWPAVVGAGALGAPPAGRPLAPRAAVARRARAGPGSRSSGISFHLALDGLSLLLVALTVLARHGGRAAPPGARSPSASASSTSTCCGSLAGIIGVFLALDLFLFYFFWELMLVPMYFLIALWGHERRVYAAIKFFLFTQVSGLLMLLAILGAVLRPRPRDRRATPSTTSQLLGTPLSPAAGHAG